MLYGNCKKILKAICYLCADQKETTTLDISVYLHNRVRDEDLVGCIRVLESEGLIKVREKDGVLLYIEPTHRGLHHKEHRRAAVIDFFMKSVFTPIIIAFTTTLITLTLERIFR